MIRDEYNKKKQTVTFNAKEERKKKEMGERNYYASQIPRINDMNKALSMSLLITLIFLGIAYAVVLVSYILLLNTDKPYGTTKFIVWTACFGALVIFFILWHTAIKPARIRKAERFKAEIDRINAENLQKMSYRYNPQAAKFNATQEQTLQKTEEKTENNENKE